MSEGILSQKRSNLRLHSNLSFLSLSYFDCRVFRLIRSKASRAKTMISAQLTSTFFTIQLLPQHFSSTRHSPLPSNRHTHTSPNPRMAPTKLQNNQTSTPKITIQPAIKRIPLAKSDSSPLTNPTPFSISTFESGTPPIATYVVRPAQIWDGLTRYRECISPQPSFRPSNNLETFN